MMRRMTVLALMMALAAVPAAAAWAQETDAPATDAPATDAPATDRASDVEIDRHTDRAEAVRKLKARALEAIDRRLETIARLQGAVSSAGALTEAHAAALSADLEDAATGLRELAAQIESATTLEELRELVPKIVEDYRVYVLLAPKVHLVIAADTMAAGIDRLWGVSEHIAEAIARAEEAGHDVTAAAAHLEAMEAALDDAETQVGPVADMVLPLQPEDWPDAAEVLREARALLGEAHASIRVAVGEAHAAVAALRRAIGD